MLRVESSALLTITASPTAKRGVGALLGAEFLSMVNIDQ